MEHNPDNSTTIIPSDSDTRTQLREAAEAADRGEEVDITKLPGANQGGGEGGEQETGSRATESNAGQDNQTNNPATSDAPKADAGKGTDSQAQADKNKQDGPARDAQGKFLKQDDKEQGQEGTKFSRAQKEQQRREKTWQQIEADKKALADERARLQQEREEFQRSRTQRQAPADTDTAGLPNLPANEYIKAANLLEAKAKKLLDEGDAAGAKEQLLLAGDARNAAIAFAKKESVAAQESHNSAWMSHVQQVCTEEPEYNDPNSERAKEMHAFIKDNPILTLVPNGFRIAHNALQLQREAAKVPGLLEENKKLKAENEKLIKLSTPAGNRNASGHSAPHNFESLTIEQQRAELRRQAEDEDARAA